MLMLGMLEPARTHLEKRGIALYDSQRHRSHASLYGIDPEWFATPMQL